ncbi:MAG TPA: XRE family transcriptional regulator, partial [Bacillaceae bacterium]
NTDFEHMTDKYKQLIYLVKPYIPKLSHGYEAARLLEMYSISLYQETLDGWKELSDRAAHMYEQLNMTARRASIGLFRSTVKFMDRDYKKALEILQKERSELEGKHAFIDHMTRVDYDYNEAAIYFALGDSESAKRVMESAIDYSRENGIFYRIDDLYRLAAAEAMMARKTEKRLYYTEKLKLYGEFADDMHSILFCELMQVESHIFEQQYNEALSIIHRCLSEGKLDEILEPYFFLGKGQAQWGLGQFNEALESLDKVKGPDYLRHPFDLSILYSVDSYKARCHLELGSREEAERLAQTARDNIYPLPHTPYKDFIMETYDAIKGNSHK